MQKMGIRILIAVWIISILSLSLYSGFSFHAENFCTTPPSAYSGRNGSVAMWLQRFGSVSTILFIIWPICIYSSSYIKTIANRDPEKNDTSRRNRIKKIGFYLFDFIFASFVLDGVFILIYVPNDCKKTHITDNYCFIAMIIIVVADILTIIFFGCIMSPRETLALEQSYCEVSTTTNEKQ
jgi:hypothetical protein